MAIVGATMQWRFFHLQYLGNVWIGHGLLTQGEWKIQHISNFSAINLTAALFTIFVLCKPCTSPFFCGKCWRIICVTIHILLHAACLSFIATCATGYLDDNRDDGRWICNSHISRTVSTHEHVTTFRTVMFSYGAHFVLGLLIFSGLNPARLVTLILSAAVFVLKKIASLCCCCRPDWRDAVNKHLNDLLLSEEEREAEERGMEETMEKEGKMEEKGKEKGEADDLEIGDLSLSEEEREAEERRREEMEEREGKMEEEGKEENGEADDLDTGDLLLSEEEREAEERRREEIEEREGKMEEKAKEENSEVDTLEMGGLDSCVGNLQLLEERRQAEGS